MQFKSYSYSPSSTSTQKNQVSISTPSKYPPNSPSSPPDRHPTNQPNHHIHHQQQRRASQKSRTKHSIEHQMSPQPCCPHHCCGSLNRKIQTKRRSHLHYASQRLPWSTL